MKVEIYDCIIIGAGIAGMTASIYLKRENLNVLILEKEMPGGQLAKSPLVENYPGYSKVEGSTLALTIYDQVSTLGVPVEFEEVIEISDEDDYKLVKTMDHTYKTKTILLATGRSPRKLGIEGEDRLYGRGISYCATCDGAFYKDKHVAVVGGGNSASIEALFLANLCKKVTLIHRKDSLRSEDALKQKLQEKDNIEIIYNTSIIKLEEKEHRLAALELSNGENITIDGLFVYIGFVPNIVEIKGLEKLGVSRGYIVTNDSMETNMPNIYACGDSIQKKIYQLTTAVGEACIAAEKIKEKIIINQRSN